MNDKKVPKSPVNFYCQKCDYNTDRISHYNRHILTPKHKMMTNNDIKIPEIPEYDIKLFKCECGKSYKYRQGLSVHKKKCEYTDEDEKQILTSLVLEIVKHNHELVFHNKELVQQNQDLTNKLVDICKSSNTNSNNVIQHSNNKTFNLQLFLNETCKDAMNIMDFVNSLQIQLSDLENVGKDGYVKGISNIIIKNLKALDVDKRPLHCSDSKREILYIKDENKWEKEDGEKKKLKKAIKYIANKNCKLIKQFKDKYPDCIYSDSNKSDQYNKIIIEAYGGEGDNDDEKCEKIIKKIAKEVVIDKNSFLI